MNLCTSIKTDFLAFSQRTVLKRKHTPSDYKGPLSFFLSFGLLYKLFIHVKALQSYKRHRNAPDRVVLSHTNAARMSVMYYLHVFVDLFAYLSGQYTDIIPGLQLLNVFSQL